MLERIAQRLTHQSLAARLLRPIANRLLPDRPMAVTVHSGPGRGLRLMIEPRREKYYWTGTHERAVADALANLLNPGDIFWDVGAHIGYFSFIASRLVAPTGRVHAFEPVPANVARLKQGVALNGFNAVEVHAMAISDRVGEAILRPAQSSLMWRLAGDPATGPLVHCTTLDMVLTEFGPPNLLKIDVEGAEAAALRGGRALLATRIPIVIEFLSDEARAVIAQLCPQYNIERLDPKNWLMTPQP